MTTAGESSKSTGPESPDSETSDQSEPVASKQLTLLPAASLASLTVWPGSEQARKTTETSGRNFAAYLPRSNPATSLLRTFLESSAPISTRSYLTWRTSVTPAGRLIFQLWPSMPRIDDTEFSLLPTSSAWDGQRGPAREYDPKSDSQKDRNLNTFARVFPRSGMWPTPRAGKPTSEDPETWMKRQKAGKVATPPLGMLARLWPSPSAQQAGEGLLDRVTDKDGKEPKPNERIYNPTTGKHIQVSLNRAVRLWPTASSRDWKDTPGMAQEGTNPDGSKRKRTDQLARAVYATPKSSPSGPDYARKDREGSGGDDLTTQIGGQLNPTWVEWLMGFPLGWTDLEPLETQ